MSIGVAVSGGVVRIGVVAVGVLWIHIVAEQVGVCDTWAHLTSMRQR